MRANGSHIILRICLALALIFQSLLPAAVAVAQTSGHDVSAFICNPSNNTPSAQAQAQIDNLLAVLNNHPNEEPAHENAEHCSNCVVSFHSLLTAPLNFLTSTTFPSQKTRYFQNYAASIPTARGPPLGGRAPPIFQ